MAERESSRDIDQAASDWAARLDRGPLTPEENAHLSAWLEGDPRRKGALLRAQALSLMSESAQALGPGFDPAAFGPPQLPARPSRRKALIWTGSALAAATLAAIGMSIPAAGAVISTARGEIRLVPLQDGSTVLLNTDSSIRIPQGSNSRSVTLLEGEAYFSVARDAQHPFVVEVDGHRMRTTQAGFRVRKLAANPVDVLVDRGQVDLAARGGESSNAVLALTANTRLRLVNDSGAAERPESLAPEAVTRELSWREGKLAFEGETLNQAAASFARYSDLHIQIDDPELAREPVTGLFAANDPMGFSRAVARVFNANLVRQDGRIVLTRTAAQ
ncbi:FecR domain-containing protein [Sphingomonas psychrotolerans]|uniref:FecR domain-containing protein n=1 Tax=Sphingomonas psychrotolerans TaxID=1327635 RepID=A0ABU3N0T5_9SPHN|nr:FecR domain-containing protein [Sphingomonas psychrotolerans]MDT8758088.1 FecR domain-containing protein [Sphingomonas psychrotolerans]